MNAILVFDPSNDLLFAKCNKLFRRRVLKYSRSHGLIAGSQKIVATTSSSSHDNNELIENASSSSSPSSSVSSSSSSSCPYITSSDYSRSSDSCSVSTFAATRSSSRSSCIPSESESESEQCSKSQSLKRASATYLLNQQAKQRNVSRSRPTGKRSRRPEMSMSAGGGDFRDTSKSYLELLMLLLTPYVASLRLSSSLRDELEQEDDCSRRHEDESQKHNAPNKSQQKEANEGDDEDDLLSKFMSSIQVNHECAADEEETGENEAKVIGDKQGTRHQKSDRRNVTESDSNSSSFLGSSREFGPIDKKVATIPMPIECLEDCQIVFCELGDFIFILMQEFEQVSSFKMRLLQKRVDLFARLSLFLLGPSLNSMRINLLPDRQTDGSNIKPQPVVQSQILRQVCDTWTSHQFEPEFWLEAGERLLVGPKIEGLCRDTLRKVSIHLRRPASCFRRQETHMHALLFSDTKQVARYSCRNSQSLQSDDLCLLRLLLKTFNLHHDNQLLSPSSSSSNHDSLLFQRSSDNCATTQLNNSGRALVLSDSDHDDDGSYLQKGDHQPNYCYASNYNANRQTYEINSPPTSDISGANSVQNHDSRFGYSRTGGHAHPFTRKRRDGKRPQGRSRQVAPPLPNQLMVFLATGGQVRKGGGSPKAPEDRPRVPHILRLVPLTRGVTLLLISELSTAYLSLQLSSALRILSDFRFNRRTNRRQHELKLGQLGRINDCVCAIKSYFYGPNYATQESQPRLPVIAQPPARGETNSPGALSWLNKLYLRTRTKPTAGEQLPVSGIRQPVASSSSRCLYDTLDEESRRQCRQLVCRLEDLASNNVHTYMRRAFSLSTDERQRAAILSSAGAALREAAHQFVVRPQLELLNEWPPRGYARHFDELLAEVKLIAGEELSDYLDYLAVKANCNVTLGAPLSHDMPALSAFIYVDRSRQEMLCSPIERSSHKLDRRSVLEADLCNSNRREEDAEPEVAADEEEESDGESSDGLSRGDLTSGQRARGSWSAASGQERKWNSFTSSKRHPFPATSSDLMRGSAASWLLGASGDLTLKADGSSLSSQRSFSRANSAQSGSGSMGDLLQSMAKFGNHRQSTDSSSCRLSRSRWPSGGSTSPPKVVQVNKLRSGSSFDRIDDSDSYLMDNTKPRELVDENLIKGFACFAYDRLARGRTSYSSSDGTYTYSYFLWFKRRNLSEQVVKPNEDRKLEVSRKLAANCSSLPSVVCGDFFASYTNSLFMSLPAEGGGRHRRNSAQSTSSGGRRRNQVLLTCKVSHLDERMSRLLVRRHLSQVKEEEEEDDYDDSDACSAYRNRVGLTGSESPRSSMSHSLASSASGNDRVNSNKDEFSVFLSSQMSGSSSKPRTRVYHERGSRRPNPSKLPVKTKREQREEEKVKKSMIEQEPQCFELFCVHKTSLLVHRDQVLLEAERLARRLAQLTASGNDCIED